MTIRPRHYAELMVNDDAAKTGARLEALEALSGLGRELAARMTTTVGRTTVAEALTTEEVDELIRSLIADLARHRRVHWLPAIIRTAERLLADQGQAAVVHVSVARNQVVDQTTLRDQLASILGPVGSVRLHQESEMLGGIALRVADRSLDARLSSRLERIRTALNNSRTHKVGSHDERKHS